MKRTKTIFTGALALMLALHANAQTEPVIINGSIIDWYVYGPDIHSSSNICWHQQNTGGGSDDSPCNYGLMSINTSKAKAVEIDQTARKTTGISEFDFMIRHHVLYSNASGVYVGNNTYYSFFMGEGDEWTGNMETEVGSENYTVKVRKWTWDGVDSETGLYTNVKYQYVNTIKTQPIDLTYDPYNDVVYGVFYDGSTYKIGTIDLETLKVTYISKEGLLYGAPQCIAVNSKGVLYTIDASGNVCTVDKKDGTLTTIGNVGFTSQARRMSATFDLRTDKLYWVGFINNGKSSESTSGTNTTLSASQGGRDTGLFEVNTQTGAATLIGELYQEIGAHLEGGNLVYDGYRGLQMTGIYVKDCFTRKDHDLRIMLTSTPVQMKPKEQGTVKVNVKNVGTQLALAKNYVVKLWVNGTCVEVRDRDHDTEPVDNLSAGVSQELTFTFQAPAKSGELQIYATVEYTEDEQTSNNTTETASVNLLVGYTLPNVTLTGSAVDNEDSQTARVTLSWSNPKGHVVEGAEDFTAFTYDGLNDWIMVDGDGGYTQKPNNMFDTVDYPNWGTPKAFIVMDPFKAGLGPDLNSGGEKWLAHNGNQYFAAFFSAKKEGDQAVECDNSDYMVSPELTGDAQTVKFWAKGYRGLETAGMQTDMAFNETVEILYTTDASNVDPTTYSVAKEEFTIDDKAWTLYSAELPAGTKRFALHRTSLKRQYTEPTEEDPQSYEIPGTGSFVMMIDDVEFDIAPKTVKSYKIYQNGQFLSEVAAVDNQDAYQYVINSAGFADVFVVTAVYEEAESADSNPYGVTLTEADKLVTPPYYGETWDITAGSYMMYASEYSCFLEGNRSQTMNVCIDGTDIYIQGISGEYTTSWIKGTLADGKATFPTAQFIAHNSYVNGQLQSAQAETDAPVDIVFAYDSEAGTLTLDASMGIIENDNTTTIAHTYAYWEGLVLTNPTTGIHQVDIVEGEETVIGYFNLHGQQVDPTTKGLLIKQVRLSDGTLKTQKVMVQ